RVRSRDADCRQWTAVGQDACLVGGRVPAREAARDRLGQYQRHRVGARGQLVERHRLVDRERADPGTAQCGEVTADAQGHAEVTGERAHVRARRARHVDVHVDQYTVAPYVERVEAGHGDGTRRERDVLPRAHPGVRANAADLDGRHGAGYLLDLA